MDYRVFFFSPFLMCHFVTSYDFRNTKNVSWVQAKDICTVDGDLLSSKENNPSPIYCTEIGSFWLQNVKKFSWVQYIGCYHIPFAINHSMSSIEECLSSCKTNIIGFISKAVSKCICLTNIPFKKRAECRGNDDTLKRDNKYFLYSIQNVSQIIDETEKQKNCVLFNCTTRTFVAEDCRKKFKGICANNVPEKEVRNQSELEKKCIYGFTKPQNVSTFCNESNENFWTGLLRFWHSPFTEFEYRKFTEASISECSFVNCTHTGKGEQISTNCSAKLDGYVCSISDRKSATSKATINIPRTSVFSSCSQSSHLKSPNGFSATKGLETHTTEPEGRTSLKTSTGAQKTSLSGADGKGTKKKTNIVAIVCGVGSAVVIGFIIGLSLCKYKNCGLFSNTKKYGEENVTYMKSKDEGTNDDEHINVNITIHAHNMIYDGYSEMHKQSDSVNSFNVASRVCEDGSQSNLQQENMMTDVYADVNKLQSKENQATNNVAYCDDVDETEYDRLHESFRPDVVNADNIYDSTLAGRDDDPTYNTANDNRKKETVDVYSHCNR